MCGIFGVVSRYTLTEKQRDFIGSCLQAGQVRGLHGTGLMLTNWENKVSYVAAAITGTEMVKRANTELDGWASAKTIIGHNRHATVGDHIDENCHPFQYGNIVGMHNGTLPAAVADYIDPENTHEVDSARLYAAISRADNPADILSKVWGGAYSLVWHNTEENKLYFARNCQRPMCIAVTHDALYFASEMGMLTWLLARHHLGPYKDGTITVAETNTETLYSIDLTDLSNVTAEPYKVEARPARPEAAATKPVGEMVAAKFNDEKDKAEAANPDKVDRYEHRASRYFKNTADIVAAYPKLSHLVEFIDANISDFYGDAYYRGYIQVCDLSDEKDLGEEFCGASGYLTDVLGNKEESWSVLARMIGTRTRLEAIDQYMPGEKTDPVAYPMFDVYVVGYEVRPTGEIICICAPVMPIQTPELYIEQEDDNEAVWALYACSEDYLCEMTDDQVYGLWAELMHADGDSKAATN